MTRLALFLLLLTATLARAQNAVNPRVDGLELPAPLQVAAGSGFVKIKAVAQGLVVYDVFAVFADPKVKVQFDVAPDGTLYLGIPASAGAIRVSACTSIDGKPSAIASTLVTITEQSPQPSPEPDGPQPVTSGQLVVTLVGVVESAPLRQALEKAGHKLWVYQTTDRDYATREDILREVAAAGGAPCLLVTDAGGKLLFARKLPEKPSDSQIIRLVNEATKGQ